MEFDMGRSLYVGNLDFGISCDDLKQLFAQHGTVARAVVVLDHLTQLSRGFGFVEMGTEQEADAAMAALNGKDCAGRTLAVAEARPRSVRQ